MKPGTQRSWADRSLRLVPTPAKSAMSERSGLKRFWVKVPAVEGVAIGGARSSAAFSKTSMRRRRSSLEGVGLFSGAATGLGATGGIGTVELSAPTVSGTVPSDGCANSKAVVKTIWIMNASSVAFSIERERQSADRKTGTFPRPIFPAAVAGGPCDRTGAQADGGEFLGERTITATGANGLTSERQTS